MNNMVRFYSRFLNLSREGLKFYEQKGIISPDRDRHSGYRIYNWKEINIVMMCKKLRKFGFSLNSIVGMIHQGSTDKIIEQFQRQRDVVAKELEEKTQALLHLENKINQLKAVSPRGGGG
ncbi:MAG: MerR family transcriptional regulator, partial [Spirochaetaceae bacterium]|nr:MerR family transcriptional regulator [Spirochaetaceae bacterium]